MISSDIISLILFFFLWKPSTQPLIVESTDLSTHLSFSSIKFMQMYAVYVYLYKY